MGAFKVCVCTLGGLSSNASSIYVFIGLFLEITAQSQTIPQSCHRGGANAAHRRSGWAHAAGRRSGEGHVWRSCGAAGTRCVAALWGVEGEPPAQFKCMILDYWCSTFVDYTVWLLITVFTCSISPFLQFSSFVVLHFILFTQDCNRPDANGLTFTIKLDGDTSSVVQLSMSIFTCILFVLLYFEDQ